MLKNYIKTAWRNLLKHQFHSVLNILGLAIGIVFALLIGAYVWNEMQVNQRLRNAKNQYFLTSEWKDPNMGVNITTLGPLSKRLKEEYPALVANYYRWDGITSVVSKGDKHLRENIQLGDSTLLSMYGFSLFRGDVRTALTNPYSAVIAKSIAIKYFGNLDVVGKTISIQSFSGGQHEFEITGVLEDGPENSVTALNDANHNTIFIPTNTFTYFGRADFDDWTNIYVPSYIELKEGATIGALNKAIRQLVQQNAPEGIKQNLTVQPIPLTGYYLQKDKGLIKRMLYTLSFIGLFILLMAIVNFINISISNSSTRIKEIGIRKVLGGVKKQIIIQFLTESVILVLVATVLALIAYPFLRSLFGQLVGKEVPRLTAFPLPFLSVPAALVLVVGILAGLYPAIKLSALKSADSVKGKLKTVNESVALRKSLTGFQFCVACVVIIATFIISRQVDYFFSQSLGYNKDFIVSSQVPRDWSVAGVRKMERVRREFAAMPEISDAALSYEIPNGIPGSGPLVYKTGSDSTKAVAMQSIMADGNYLDVYQVPLKAGEFFGKDAEADSLKVVLNERAVKALGFTTTNEAIGKELRIPGSSDVFTVKGVTRDFHFGSMQQEIQPALFFKVRFTKAYRFLSFKIRSGNVADQIAAIEKKWAVLLPGSSFEYSFMDDSLKKIYKTELQLKGAAYTAMVLSLVIVLMGVLGLVSLSIQKRTKEIGIRKVLGASAMNISALFLKDFLPVILLGGLVAVPVGWWVMRAWLNDYAYRIAITAQPFLLSFAALGLLTVLLIMGQSAKKAFENPVENLRSE